jgi:hypothetical protein
LVNGSDGMPAGDRCGIENPRAYSRSGDSLTSLPRTDAYASPPSEFSPKTRRKI